MSVLVLIFKMQISVLEIMILLFKIKPEDHWSGIAHLSAENMLKSAVKRSLNIALGQGQTTH